MNRFSRQIIPAFFLAALAILIIDSLLVYRSLATIARAHREVDETREVLAELERSLSLLRDAETGQRGFLLTGNEEYLTPFLQAQAGIEPTLEKLRLITVDRAREHTMTIELGKVASAKIAELDRTIRLRKEGKASEAIAGVQTGLGKRLMDQARDLVSRIKAEEDLLLDARDVASRSALRWTISTFTLTTGTALALLLGYSVLQRRETAVRDRAAEAVRQSADWLSTTLASIGDAVIATDGEARVTFMNPIAQTLTGWSQAEAAGKPMHEVFSIVNESTRAVVDNPVDKVIREGVIVGLANHTILIARDGSETPIDDSAAPIKDSQGNVAGVVLVFRDITERKKQEDLLEEKRRLAEFGRVVGIALTESPDLESLMHRCVEETVRYLDGTFARIWTLEDGADVLELRASAGLYTHINGDHSRVPVGKFKIGKIAEERKPHLTNQVVGDPQVPAQEWAAREGIISFAGYPLIVEDRLVGVWAMFARHTLSDATLRAMESVASGIALGIERMTSADRLREAGNRLRFTLEATQVGQWDLDLATGESIRSLRHDQIFGYDSLIPSWTFQTFLSRHVREDQRDRVSRDFHEIQENGREWDFECPIVRVDGSEGWIWVKGSLYGGETGKPRRMLGLIMDITDRKQVAEELRIAKEEAEHANQAKTRFLAILSHELRTPLNPILLAVSSMLERPSEPEDFRPNLEMIRQNVNLQSRLIDDLLDVMRIVRGKMPLHWEVANAHSLIENAIQICRSEVFGKNLSLALEFKADRRHINADPVRLQQVVWNLVKNAVKFTPAGGSITVRTSNEADTDGRAEQLVIEVIDTGIGIEEAVIGRIFDPFQQGETSITRQFGGLGLGLAISRGIIEGHGGTLIAESPGKNQGTRFRIALGVLPDPTIDENGRVPSDSKVVDASPINPLKILLVEDEQATRRLMARLLKGLGHEVTMAATITEALEKEKETDDIGLIVSDIGLPDGTGLELMRQVVARRGPVPAIALTGYGMEEDIHRSREAGFTAHMTKPIDFAKLEAMIRQVVS